MITEALLEMHFHHAIVERFSHLFGANFLMILKPSPRQEAWVGFDQGWVHTTLSEEKFISDLQAAVHSGTNQVDKFYLGFFLQFKKVNIISRKRKHYPRHYYSPFLRVELDLTPNETTGISQHHTLLRLRSIVNAYVAYACPMFFEINDIYKPDLTKLRIKSLTDAPDDWKPNTSHFICFQTQDDASPFWLSEPVIGKAYSFNEWASGDFEESPKKMNAQQILNLLHDFFSIKSFFRGRHYFKKGSKKYIKYLPESLTIIEFRKKEVVRSRAFNFDL